MSHICCTLGTLSFTDLHFDTPESWTNKEIPLPQHTWNMHIIAFWNACAKWRLNNLNPTWTQDLANNIPEAHWHLTNIKDDPIIYDWEVDMGPGSRKLISFPPIRHFLPTVPTALPWMRRLLPPTNHTSISSWNFTTGSHGPTLMAAALSMMAKKSLGEMCTILARTK